MDMLRAGLREQHRLRGGIIAIDRGTVHITFGQADDLAIFQVDGGKDDEAQGHHSRKRERKERP